MTMNLRGIELHLGDEQVKADIVAAAKDSDFRPAITIKPVQPGSPAYGFVENLRLEGRRLVADFTHLHPSVFDAICKKKFDRIACEVYEGLRRAGKTFRHALRSVRLIGAPEPELVKLVPVGQMEFAAAEAFDRVNAVNFNLNLGANVMDTQTAGETLDARVKAYRLPHPEVRRYEDAMKAVLAADPALHRTYADHGTPQEQELEASPGWRIAKLMALELERHPTWDSMTALQAVLRAHPDLADEYRKHPTTASNLDAVMGADRSRGI